MKYCTLFLLLISGFAKADSLFSDDGFHWYSKALSKPKIKIEEQNTPKMHSHYEALMQLRRQAKESLARAILEPSVANTADYMQRQKVFIDANQKFIQNWQKALILYPELDYKLHHPTDNNAIALKNDELAKHRDAVIKASSKEFGLMLFYRGNSEISTKFIGVLHGFIRTYSMEMIAVSTDGKIHASLPKSILITQESLEEKMGVKTRYQPAVFLVHLKTKKIKPLSYGFMAYEDFKQRVFDVVTNFKRLSDEGIEL